MFALTPPLTTAFGYGLGMTLSVTAGLSEDLLGSALITTACGVSRAIGTIAYNSSTGQQILNRINSLFDDSRPIPRKNISLFLQLHHLSLGFSMGIIIGSAAWAPLPSSFILNLLTCTTITIAGEMIPLACYQPNAKSTLDKDWKAFLLEHTVNHAGNEIESPV